jgi:hypothetical protein
VTAPKADRSDYMGCGLWVGGFVVLVIISFAVGVILRPDSEQSDLGVQPDDIELADVGPDGEGYRLIGDQDEEDDDCVVLFQRQAEVTGQCGVTLTEEGGAEDGRYGVTSSVLDDGTTVVFGPVPEGTNTVTFALSDGTEAEVEVQTNESAGISFFVYETDQEVEGSATFLGTDGEPIG